MKHPGQLDGLADALELTDRERRELAFAYAFEDRFLPSAS